VSRLYEVLDVEQVVGDRFVGPAPKTLLQRTFGGQVAAQALTAATRTVPPELAVHSMHAYFLREGDPHGTVDYDVDRIRDGRSFMTRHITGTQQGKAIFSMTASFHTTDPGPEHQEPMPSAPGPDEVIDTDEDADWHRAHRTEWPEWDIRRVSAPRGALTQQVWLRHRDPLPDDPVLHACALAYITDLTLLGCARRVHPDLHLQMASLDHAVWFHRPHRVDGWMLYDQLSPSGGLGRGLSTGRIFSQDGQLVATVVQEGLMRTHTPR
jgi:acyl-CoA thioesterase-2